MANTVPVLLIEDNPGDAHYIREMLAESGDVRFELTSVSRLQEGLALLDRQRYGAVLLDLTLPDSQGLDTFRELRDQTNSDAIPVVVLTGLSDTQAALQAVADGAQDYLVKQDVTAARLVHALRFAISRFQQQQAVTKAHHDNEIELGVARQIWKYLLPREHPKLPGLSIHAECYPAVETGGDFYDYLYLTPEQIGIVVGDVTSHGVGPALLMAATRAYIRAFSQTTKNIGDILALTNRMLVKDVNDRSVTLMLVSIDAHQRVLQHTSAGHWPGYILDSVGNVRASLLSTELALGTEAGLPFTPESPIPLHSGDLILLYTDGIIEARSPQGKLFGSQRMLDHVREHQDEPVEDIVTSLHAAAREWEGNGSQGDDITALVVKVD